MRLYLDNEYNPDFRDLVKALHRLDDTAEFEVVDGRWQDSYRAKDTVVFITDDTVNSVSAEARDYYNDGFRVFAWRKPFGRGLDVFKQSLTMLGQWKAILGKIRAEKKPFVCSISEERAKTMYDMLPARIRKPRKRKKPQQEAGKQPPSPTPDLFSEQ